MPRVPGENGLGKQDGFSKQAVLENRQTAAISRRDPRPSLA
jgi:hypothetical protein